MLCSLGSAVAYGMLVVASLSCMLKNAEACVYFFFPFFLLMLVLLLFADADVESVTCDQWTKKVCVTSFIPPKKLLERLQKFKARSTFWSHRPS